MAKMIPLGCFCYKKNSHFETKLARIWHLENYCWGFVFIWAGMNYEKYTAAYKLLTAITNITYNYNILYTQQVNKIDIPSRITQVRTRAKILPK